MVSRRCGSEIEDTPKAQSQKKQPPFPAASEKKRLLQKAAFAKKRLLQKKEPPFPAAFEVDNREASNRVDRSHSVSKRGQCKS